MLREHATLHPDREAVVEVGGERRTYRELWDRASAVAGGLRDQGLGRGDRVAVRYPAGVDWVVAFFGTVLAGGITVVPNIRSTATEMAVVLDDAGVTFDLGPGTTLPHGEPFQHDQLGPDDIAAMF